MRTITIRTETKRAAVIARNMAISALLHRGHALRHILEAFGTCKIRRQGMHEEFAGGCLYRHRAGRQRDRVREDDMTHFGCKWTWHGDQLLADGHVPGQDDLADGDGRFEDLATQPTPIKEQRGAELEGNGLIVQQLHAPRKIDSEKAGEHAKREQEGLEIARK